MKTISNLLQHLEENSTSLNRSTKLIGLNEKNWQQMANAVFKLGREFTADFSLNNEKQELYKDLLLYFTGNKGNLDLNKGVWLYGNFGIGKTATMSIFSRFLARFFPFSANGYGITSIEKIAEHYKQHGNLSRYGRCIESNEKDQGRGVFIETEMTGNRYCINELGKPLNEKHFGTNIQDVINSMLMVRYELFQEKKILTHATSNYSPIELECFDSALLDRFSEMFNFVELKGESHR